jgi:NAD+-dependent protein deacetylase sirtuin 5
MSRRTGARTAIPKILLSFLSSNPRPLNYHCLRRSTFMASSAASADLESFSEHLQASQRILALLGAGLSASSGLPTFRGAGGLWRSHDAMSLATPEAFDANPGLVWQFYSYRRHMALAAKPNRAHYALAELARRKEGFATLSQNVDGGY